jgi:hypothetical protein
MFGGAITPGGRPALVTLLRDQLLPEGVPEDRIRHLLDMGMIVEFGES